MFVSLCLSVCLVACVFAAESANLDNSDPYSNALNSLTCVHDRTLNLDVSGIKVYFFDFANNLDTSFLIKDAAEGILNLVKHTSRPFTMFVGGFTSHIEHDIEKQMKDAYKTHTNSYLIIPDHSEYTHDTSLKGYKQAVTHAYYIGKALGEMLAKVNLGGVNASNIHCVGFSLGGQILGYLGTTFTEMTDEKISRVTALDPAGPCFAKGEKEDQVRTGVAQYVDVYHCNAGGLGSASKLGDADFLVNKNGEEQRNCEFPLFTLPSKMIAQWAAALCAHRTCVNLWTASVKKPNMFVAYSCESYEEFEKGSCYNNTNVVAGAGNRGVAKGIFYFSTSIYNSKKICNNS